MNGLRSIYRNTARDRGGAVAIEYGLIVALIFVAILAAANGLGDANSNQYNKISTDIGDALDG
ncbi:MAG: Flp family type IVb pilin [Pseudomonadota bacterium]